MVALVFENNNNLLTKLTDGYKLIYKTKVSIPENIGLHFYVYVLFIVSSVYADFRHFGFAQFFLFT